MGHQGVPLRDDNPNGREDGDKSQPSEFDEDHEIKPPPRFAPTTEIRRCADPPSSRVRSFDSGGRGSAGVTMFVESFSRFRKPD